MKLQKRASFFRSQIRKFFYFLSENRIQTEVFGIFDKRRTLGDHAVGGQVVHKIAVGCLFLFKFQNPGKIIRDFL